MEFRRHARPPAGPPRQLTRFSSRPVDVHELLKREVFFRKGGDGCASDSPPADARGLSDQYMVLDSFHKSRAGSRPEEGVFKFNFMIQGVTGDQVIGVVDRLDTVIGIETGAFCVPRLLPDEFDPGRIVAEDPALEALGLEEDPAVPAPDPAAPLGDPRTQLPFCGRITMFLREIGLQSYSDSNSRRHHFEFAAEAAGDRLKLTPPTPCARYFLFTNPIQDVHGLTVCFFNPDQPVKFPPDVLYGAAAENSPGGKLIFEYADPTGLLFLAAGDRVFVRGFRSENVLLDRWVGRPEGHLVGTVTPGPGNRVSFPLSPGPTALNALGIPPGAIRSQGEIAIYVAKNRIRIPLRFRRVVDRVTNFVSL